MEAKELRIGNTILYKGKVIDISMVVLFQLYHLSDNHADSKKDKLQYEPIPLTEEWLLRFGFKHYGQGEAIFCHKKIYLYYRNNIFYFHKTIRFEILYVHQLQNLYFALTGLELEYEQN